jgi:hypothetical protein
MMVRMIRVRLKPD